MTEQGEHLVRRSAEGDLEAFSELAMQHEPWVFQRAYTLSRDFHLAEDLTQETLVEAWKSIARYNGTCRLNTWLYSILMHRYQKALGQQGVVPDEISADRKSPTRLPRKPWPLSLRKSVT